MISYCTDRTQIIRLWRQAFGDSTDDINFFIDNVKDAQCLAYYEGDTAVSMMYLVKCVANGRQANYIYAACTLDDFKGKGFMTKLINFCRSSCMTVCLIPASDSLVEYYSARGISHKIPIESLVFEQIPEIEEYLFEGYNLSRPAALISEE